MRLHSRHIHISNVWFDALGASHTNNCSWLIVFMAAIFVFDGKRFLDHFLQTFRDAQAHCQLETRSPINKNAVNRNNCKKQQFQFTPK